MSGRKFTASLATATAVAALGLGHPACADSLGRLATRAMAAAPHAPHPHTTVLALMTAAPQTLQKRLPLDQPRHTLDLRAPDPRSIAGMEGAGGDYRASFPIRWQKYSELVNPQVELDPDDGDRARAHVTWLYVVKGEDGAPALAKLGHYDDELVREAGRWRFQRREAPTDIPAT